jgi:hypothetical protein
LGLFFGATGVDECIFDIPFDSIFEFEVSLGSAEPASEPGTDGCGSDARGETGGDGNDAKENEGIASVIFEEG